MKTTKEEYLNLGGRYNLIPVCRQWLVDTETPVTLYHKMAPLKPVYLLESVEGGEHVARYSFIGLSPFARFTSKGYTVTYDCDGRGEKLHGPPLDLLGQILSEFNCPKIPGLPRFYGGAVGYMGYDVVTTVEKLPQTTADDLNLPDTFFVLCNIILIYDHARHTLTGVINSRVGEDAEKDFHRAQQMLDDVEKLLNQSIYMNVSYSGYCGPPESNFSREQFIGAVKQAKEYIAAGDIFQVVLSQRFACRYTGDSFQVYRRLRSINPSPYMYYFNVGEISIAGASPEMLVRVEEGVVQTRPIAGTRPRGKNQREDDGLAVDLLADEKEQAEHVMLVDLGRNDLGRVCQPGTVQVDSFMQVERYSHVMHLVSNVTGRLEESSTPADAFKACFPAGTVSGAPKIRAMEIIDELEPTRRGLYSGAVGYFGYNGELDTAIAIRTMVFYQGQVYFQAGAGIVADSNPESEYQECLNKAKVLARSLGISDLNGGVNKSAIGD